MAMQNLIFESFLREFEGASMNFVHAP